MDTDKHGFSGNIEKQVSGEITVFPWLSVSIGVYPWFHSPTRFMHLEQATKEKI